MATETWAQVRTYMDHSWDVPDDHFTEDVLCHWNGFRDCLTEDERFFVRSKGKWKPDISDSAFNVPSGNNGFHGWNPKCVLTIYFINWKIEQARMIRERGTTPKFLENKKTSSELRREAGEEMRRAGIKTKYGATKSYRDKKNVWWID
jgi:hypothetical protein